MTRRSDLNSAEKNWRHDLADDSHCGQCELKPSGLNFIGGSSDGLVQAFLHRAWLRVCVGSGYWHYRFFPPALHIDCDHRRILLSRGGHSVRAKWYSLLRGTERGRCHVVLSGPSVNAIAQPERLGLCYGIWANGSPALASAVNIKPSLYVVTDRGYLKRRHKDYLQYASIAQSNLINFAGASELLKRSSLAGNYFVFDDPDSPWHRARPRKVLDADDYCADQDANTNCIRVRQTVAITCLLAAMDLGFTDIYVFGLDLGGRQRFYAEALSEPSHLARDFDLMHREFLDIAQQAKSRGVRIINCSVDSRLDANVFPKQDANEALAEICP